MDDVTTIDEAQRRIDAERASRAARRARQDAILDGKRDGTTRDGRLTGTERSVESVLAEAAARGVTPWVSDEEVARYEAGRERERRRKYLDDAGLVDVLTEPMADAVCRDTLGATEALDLTRRWVAYQRGSNRDRGSLPILALVGHKGRGKTVAGAWLLASEGGRYIAAEDLCRLHSARFGPDREQCARLLRSRVLVVDEIGTEEDRARASAALSDVVDRRQGNARLTLLAGNLSKAAIVERYDPRMIDRLRAVGTVVELSGESMRQGAL